MAEKKEGYRPQRYLRSGEFEDPNGGDAKGTTETTTEMATSNATLRGVAAQNDAFQLGDNDVPSGKGPGKVPR